MKHITMITKAQEEEPLDILQLLTDLLDNPMATVKGLLGLDKEEEEPAA